MGMLPIRKPGNITRITPHFALRFSLTHPTFLTRLSGSMPPPAKEQMGVMLLRANVKVVQRRHRAKGRIKRFEEGRLVPWESNTIRGSRG